MENTNYFSGVVRILESPKNNFIQSKISRLEVRAEIPQIRDNKIILLVFWGNLALELKNYYKRKDYILIEGYTSIQNKQVISKQTNSKEIIIKIFKIYSF